MTATLVTTLNQRSRFRLQGKGSYGPCDECGTVALRWKTGRCRKFDASNGGDPNRAELLCERCGERLSTDDDPMGVMPRGDGDAKCEI